MTSCKLARRKEAILRANDFSSLQRKERTFNQSFLPRQRAHDPVGLQQRPFACATKTTASSSPLNRASSVAEFRPKRITFALRNRVRLGVIPSLAEGDSGGIPESGMI